jgi:two-component system, cell cycle sensor histidine kinase PleC
LSEDIFRDIRIERILMIHRMLPSAAIVNSLASVLIISLLDLSGKFMSLWVWALAFQVIAVLQILTFFRHRKTPPPTNPSMRHSRRAIIWSGIIGSVWGSFVAVHFANADLENQFILALVAGGMAAGTVVTLTSHPLAAVAYLIGGMVLPTIIIALQGTPIYLAMAFLSVIFTTFLAVACRLSYLALVRSIKLQRHNLQLLQTAREANQSKAHLLAQFSHELRTPLNGIIGFSEMIQNNVLGPIQPKGYREYAGHILDSGKHLLGLIENIMGASRLEAQPDELKEEIFDPTIVINSAVLMVKIRAERKGVWIDNQVVRVVDLKADETALRQIFLNLLSNAVQYTSEGDEITISQEHEYDGTLTFLVSDTGEGMESDQIEHAVSPFTRLPTKTNEGEAGYGLGLMIAKTLAQLHGGDLILSSELGKGTTVRLTIPPERIVEIDLS